MMSFFQGAPATSKPERGVFSQLLAQKPKNEKQVKVEPKEKEEDKEVERDKETKPQSTGFYEEGPILQKKFYSLHQWPIF